MVCEVGLEEAVTSGSAPTVRRRGRPGVAERQRLEDRAAVAGRCRRCGSPGTRVTTAGPSTLDRDEDPVVEPGHRGPHPWAPPAGPSPARQSAPMARATSGRSSAAASRGARSRPSGDAGRITSGDSPALRGQRRGQGGRPQARRRSRPTRPGRRRPVHAAASLGTRSHHHAVPAGLGHRLVGAGREPPVPGHDHRHAVARRSRTAGTGSQGHRHPVALDDRGVGPPRGQAVADPVDRERARPAGRATARPRAAGARRRPPSRRPRSWSVPVGWCCRVSTSPPSPSSPAGDAHGHQVDALADALGVGLHVPGLEVEGDPEILAHHHAVGDDLDRAAPVGQQLGHRGGLVEPELVDDDHPPVGIGPALEHVAHVDHPRTGRRPTTGGPAAPRWPPPPRRAARRRTSSAVASMPVRRSTPRRRAATMRLRAMSRNSARLGTRGRHLDLAAEPVAAVRTGPPGGRARRR